MELFKTISKIVIIICLRLLDYYGVREGEGCIFSFNYIKSILYYTFL